MFLYIVAALVYASLPIVWKDLETRKGIPTQKEILNIVWKDLEDIETLNIVWEDLEDLETQKKTLKEPVID